MSEHDEPHITINGCALSRAQAMTLRVAISTFDCDCGSDARGKTMAEAYSKAKLEIFHMILRGASTANNPGRAG
jgi:hypothetical protein